EEMLASIKKGDIQDIKFQTKHRDLFLVSITFDFCFKPNIPKSKKERIIMERGELGRIVYSAPSQFETLCHI
ncbi:hypothetical protein KKC36_03050, partial [Patescibacteria group bacterium]|nr:hypothetical protein [Patescibacteria group bacterium]